MSKFPVDAPIRKVVKSFELFGFDIVREGNHIAMLRENPDGTRTPSPNDIKPSNYQEINAENHPYSSKNIKG
jgi:hypothetical protein